MVTQAPQMPPTTEFATKADLENVVHTLSEELHSEIEKSKNRFIRALEASEQRFTKALEDSEQRLRDDFTKALEDSEQRVNANVSQRIKDTEMAVLLEIEKTKVTTLRWVVGTTVTLSAFMTGSVLAAIISLA